MRYEIKFASHRPSFCCCSTVCNVQVISNLSLTSNRLTVRPRSTSRHTASAGTDMVWKRFLFSKVELESRSVPPAHLSILEKHAVVTLSEKLLKVDEFLESVKDHWNCLFFFVLKVFSLFNEKGESQICTCYGSQRAVEEWHLKWLELLMTPAIGKSSKCTIITFDPAITRALRRPLSEWTHHSKKSFIDQFGSSSSLYWPLLMSSSSTLVKPNNRSHAAVKELLLGQLPRGSESKWKILYTLTISCTFMRIARCGIS